MAGNAPQVGKCPTQSPHAVEVKTRIILHKQRQTNIFAPRFAVYQECKTIILEHVTYLVYKSIP